MDLNQLHSLGEKLTSIGVRYEKVHHGELYNTNSIGLILNGDVWSATITNQSYGSEDGLIEVWDRKEDKLYGWNTDSSAFALIIAILDISENG